MRLRGKTEKNEDQENEEHVCEFIPSIDPFQNRSASRQRRNGRTHFLLNYRIVKDDI